jgi:hypothetical protein
VFHVPVVFSAKNTSEHLSDGKVFSMPVNQPFKTLRFFRAEHRSTSEHP